MTCRTTHHAGCACHEARHADEIARLTRERDDAMHERNIQSARVETYSAEAARLRGEVQELANERLRADHFAALLEAQGKELERLRDELVAVTAERDKERSMRRDYETCITFETSCLECARLFSQLRTIEERAELAEAIVTGSTTPPDEAMFEEHRSKNPQGWWLIASGGLFTVDCRHERLAEFAERCRAHNLAWRWIPLRDDGCPTSTRNTCMTEDWNVFGEGVPR